MTDQRWKTRALPVLLAFAAALTALCAYAMALHPEARTTRVLGQKGEPAETAGLFFNALCLREWEEASRYVLGEPELDLSVYPEDELEREIWVAYQQSWSWSLGEGARTGADSAWQRVSFSSLRPALLSEGLTEEVQAILALRVDETDDLSAVYAADGQFRAEVVEAALRQAVEERLNTPERYVSAAELTLHLLYRDGRWQILPEEELWELLSGAEGGAL